MKTLKNIITFLSMLFIIVSFSQCSGTKMIQKNMSFEIDEVYYQESNSGINIFIPMISNPKNILFDSVYFQGKETKLEYENNMLVGKFKTNTIKKPDIIMSNEPYAEYGNKAPKPPKKIPFDLKNDECVISYIDDTITKYLKLGNVARKETNVYP